MGPVTIPLEPAPSARSQPAWNVVVSIYGHCYRRAREILSAYGPVDATDYYNVLALTVADSRQFLDALAAAVAVDPTLLHCLARVIPVQASFTFRTAEEFATRARAAVNGFAPALGGKRFYVRMHRRGFRRQLSSQEQERALDGCLLATLAAAGAPGYVSFDNADAVVAIETIGPWAGVSVWQREELERYPFIRVE